MSTFEPETVRRLSRKTLLHLMPFAGFLGFVAFFDRLSLAFAGPQGLNEDLALTATAFGFAVGVFTIGYVLFEIPTSGIATRLGTKRWLIRILLTWGVLQCAVAFAPNFETLVVLRFLLGVAEAGFTPTIYHYFMTWFTRAYRPLAFVIYASILGLSAVLGPIISAGLITVGNALPTGDAFPGWRFQLFALGVLAILSAIPTRRFIVEKVEEARFLSAQERETYAGILAADAVGANVQQVSILRTIRDWRPWVIGLGFFALNYASYTIQVWTPTMVVGFQERFGTTFNIFESALVAGIPSLVAMLYAFALSWLAGKTGRSDILIGGSAVLGAVGAVWTTVAGDPFVLIVALVLVAFAGQGGTLFMPLVSRVFTGASGYSAIAIVNSLGATAALVSPILTGFLIDTTGNTNAGFYFIAGLVLVGGAIGFVAQALANRTQLTAGRFDEPVAGAPAPAGAPAVDGATPANTIHPV